MSIVEQFSQIREDGILIPSGTKVKDMLEQGLRPSKVVGLEWVYNGKVVRVEDNVSLHGIVVPGQHFVAAILRCGELNIYNPDGSMLGTLASVEFKGSTYHGNFGWFEPALVQRDDTFGVIFQSVEGLTIRCDVSAARLMVSRVVFAR